MIENIKGDIALMRRALSLTRRLCPGYMAWTLTSRAFSSLFPFVNIHLASLFINRLADIYWREWIALAAATVAANAAGIVVSAALKRQADIRDALLYRVCKQVPAERMMSIDYQSLESAKTHERVRLLDDMHEITGMRLSSAMHYLTRVVENLIQVAAAAILLSGGFARADGGAQIAAFALILTGLIAANVLVIFRSGKRHFRLYGEMLPFKKYKWYYEREYLDSYRTGREIRIFRQQDTIERDYFGSLGEYSAVSHRVGVAQGRANGVSAALSVVAQGAMYLFIGLRALRGAFGAGDIVKYVGYARRLYAGVDGALIDFVGITQVIRWLRAFFDFYDAPQELARGTLPVEKRAFCEGGDNEYEIEFRDVSFRYPGADVYALRHVSIRFRVGERLAVVGRNGSGKTTFIKLLCRLYDPTEGEITLNGIDIRKYDLAEYISIFSVVFQDFKLFAFSLGQNVAASARFDRAKVEACLRQAGFGERLNEMPDGVNTCLFRNLDESGVEISGGEAQKIALARALYKSAPFIVLDEPTAALDPMAEAEIYEKFGEIVGDKTAIFISHRLSSCRFCDDIAVFDGGQIVQRGDHNALVADENGRYRELWRAQAQYYAQSDDKDARREDREKKGKGA